MSEAVVLYLVHPFWPGRRLRGLGRTARFNKAGGAPGRTITQQNHDDDQIVRKRKAGESDLREKFDPSSVHKVTQPLALQFGGTNAGQGAFWSLWHGERTSLGQNKTIDC